MTPPQIHRLSLGSEADTLGIEAYYRAIDDDSGTTRHIREQAAVAHLVRHLFGPDATVAHRPDGSPAITAPSSAISLPTISISHSRLYAALALCRSGAPIGIDIEEWRTQLVRVAPRVLSPAETAVYATSPEMLLKAWTLKEALYKCALTPGLDFRTMITLPTDGKPTASAGALNARILFSGPVPGGSYVSLVAGDFAGHN